MKKKNRKKLFSFFIKGLLTVSLIFICQESKTIEKNPVEEIVLTLKYGIDIDVFFGPGEGEIGYAPKAFCIRNNLLAIDNHGKHEIRIFDIKQKKLIKVLSIQVGEIEYIIIGPDNTIYYSINKWSNQGEFLGKTINKISQNGEHLFISKASLLPGEIKEQIYKKFPRTQQNEINWEELFVDQYNNLYVRVLTSILQYNSKGEIIRVVPGFPSENGEFFFWLIPEEKYLIGGKLFVYTIEGELLKSCRLPKNRAVNPLFMKKYEYERVFIPIDGIDANNNVYLLVQEKKEKPIVIKKSGYASYEILYDIKILKFNLEGELLGSYKFSGPITSFTMKKQIQVTPDGSIYYWKYFEDRMELWRILPQ